MKNRNVKVVDEHNIDRNANVIFALELDGSEYVVYWIERDEASNNVFVSKVLKNIDNTYNMINIDDDDKKKEIAEIVKVLISTSVSDQNDKMMGTTLALSNGKSVRFIDVSFNKEQNINVSKTYITTVKKEVTKVAETYYDVVVEEIKVADVLPSVTPVVEPVPAVFPDLGTTVAAAPVVEPVVAPQPVVQAVPVQPTPVVVTPAPVEVAPIAVTPSVSEVNVITPVVAAQPVVEPVPMSPIAAAPVVEPVVAPQPAVQAAPVQPTPVVVEPIPVVETAQPLVFNATKETNLNAALGEVANSATIPVGNIQPVREFGVETPAMVTPEPVVASQPAAVVQTPVVPVAEIKPTAGFANSKFFMVVAVAFFLASCIFLGYEVYNYFQLVK